MAISAVTALASTAAGVASGSLAFGSVLFGASAGLFASAASHFLVTTALGAVLNALSPKSSSGTSFQRGYQSTGKGSALDHAVIYGRARVGGVVVFEEATGQNNKIFHQVVAFAGHGIESYDEIYLDGELLEIDSGGDVTSPDRFVGKVTIHQYYGTSTQTADPDLVAAVDDWTDSHRLRGIAYIYASYTFDADAFPNGVPTLTATIKGKKLYDPRTGNTVWSDNPALVVRDYLLDETYGLGEESTAIDDTLVIAAANKCDATDTKNGQPWYTCNGSFTTASTPYDILIDLLGSMGGLLWYGQGKWRMRAAEWRTPEVEYTLDDLRDSIKIQTRHSRRDNFNIVRGTFRGPETDWQFTDYPQVKNNAFISADNGQESVSNIDYPFTDNVAGARRLARIALERNRQQLTVEITTSLKGVQNQVGDNVWLTVDRYGWNKKIFEVVAWTLKVGEDFDTQVVMTLRETAQSVFDEVSDGAVYERDNTTLASPFDVPSVGILVEPFAQILDEKVVNSVDVTVSTSRPEAVDHVEVQLKQLTTINRLTGDEVAVDEKRFSLGTGEVGTFTAQDLDRGNWQVRARAINTFGIKGQWTSTETVLNSDDQKPDNVLGFEKQIAGSTLFLSWQPVSDRDLSYYQIKYNSSTTGATWDNSQTLIQKIARPATTATVIVRSGTYLIRAWDKLGQPSEDPTSLTIQPNEVPSLGTVLEFDQHPTFPGVKDNTSVDTSYTPDRLVGGNLQGPAGLRGLYYMDDGTGKDYVDTGSVKNIYITSSAKLHRYQPDAGLWDNIPQTWDTWPGTFDGWTNEDANFGDYWYKLQVSTTNDDPAGSPSWSGWSDLDVGTVVARAVRLRVRLRGDNLGVAPGIEELTFRVEY